jgi:hypothetical protein
MSTFGEFERNSFNVLLRKGNNKSVGKRRDKNGAKSSI